MSHSSNTRHVTKPLGAKHSFPWLSEIGSSFVVVSVGAGTASSDWLSVGLLLLLFAVLRLSG